MKRKFVILSVATLILFSGFKVEVKLSAYNLRCENLINPLSIDKTTPRFSWKVQSNKNGTNQKAYQILVSTDPSVPNDIVDFWNSGKIISSSSVLVPYNGKPIKSGDILFWKVRVWDQKGHVTDWSPISQFGIGLLDKNDWQAKFIGFPTNAGFSDAPQLKKSFDIENLKGRTILHVNSLGYHEIYLNGKKAGNSVLNPAVTQFNKRSLIVTYDVSDMIVLGRNDLVIWLGSGWYNKGLPGVTNNGPVVKAQLEQVKDNQRILLVSTDDSWEGRSSGYSLIDKWRSGHYGGEEVNGVLVTRAITGKKMEDGSWKPVTELVIPDHEVTPQTTELNRIKESIKPVSIAQLSVDSWLVDMGKCLTGWVEIRFPPLQNAQTVVMEYADHLNEKGELVNQGQIDRYIASGVGQETFINKFNYHGFRYIKISNIEKAPDKEAITGYLIHTDYEIASDFKCSDNDLNQIHDMLFYTLKCLSIGGDLVDCPQIERLGYGGDGNASTPTAQTMFNLGPLYSNWLQAWADCIREDGGMPHTAPNPYPAGGGPYWCGFIITASWNTFMNYGDSLVLKKYYPVMQKWLEYVDRYSVGGLLKKWPDNEYRNWYLGDWATPKGVDQKAQSSIDLVNNCFMVICYEKLQKIAKVLGHSTDENLYAIKCRELKNKIHQNFFDPSRNSYATGTQIDLIYPMLAGVVPENFKIDLTRTIINEIVNIRQGHFATGLVGIPVLTEWAVKSNAVDLFYDMLKKRDYPGYLFMIDNGATTTWEHWDGNRSRIHNCYNGIGSWFYQAVGGIRPIEEDAGYRKVIIQPQIPNGVTWAKTTKETPYGKLAVNWVLENKMMKMDIEVPVGIDAEVVIPAGVTRYNLGSKKHLLSGAGASVVNIKSGKYILDYSL